MDPFPLSAPRAPKRANAQLPLAPATDASAHRRREQETTDESEDQSDRHEADQRRRVQRDQLLQHTARKDELAATDKSLNA